MSRRIVIAIAFFILFSISQVFAEVPHYINYQGRLTDGSGDPLTGPHTLVFTIYDHPDGSGVGAVIWGPETHTDVQVADGLFDVKLGETVSISYQQFHSSPERWLEIEVNGETISPLTQYLAVPYAYLVESLEGAAGGNISGKVSIGPEIASRSGSLGEPRIDIGVDGLGPYMTMINAAGDTNVSFEYDPNPALKFGRPLDSAFMQIDAHGALIGRSDDGGVTFDSSKWMAGHMDFYPTSADIISSFGAEGFSMIPRDPLPGDSFRVHLGLDGLSLIPVDSYKVHLNLDGLSFIPPDSAWITNFGPEGLSLIPKDPLPGDSFRVHLGLDGLSLIPVDSYKVHLDLDGLSFIPPDSAWITNFGPEGVIITDNLGDTLLSIGRDGQVSSGSINIDDVVSLDATGLTIDGAFHTTEIGDEYFRIRTKDVIPVTVMSITEDQASFSGNVGIGTNSPAVKLEVTDMIRVGDNTWPSSGRGLELAYNTTENKGYIQTYDRDSASWGDLIVGGAMGDFKVGIGTELPSAKLDVDATSDPGVRAAEFRNNYSSSGIGTAAATMTIENTNAQGIALNAFSNSSDAAVVVGNADASGTLLRCFGVSSQVKFEVKSNGRVGINTSTPSVELQVNGSICYTGSIGACSDARYKKDISNIKSALATVSRLRGVTYRWKQDEYPDLMFDDQTHLGLLAQEVAEHIPEVVLTDDQGHMSVDYGRLTPVLIEAIKEQQETIDHLGNELGELRAENTDIKSQLTYLTSQLETILAQQKSDNSELAVNNK